MQKESRISVLPAVLAIVASVLSAYVTGRVMLMQQAMVVQDARGKTAGDTAYKELQKVRQLSYELNGLTEQLISSIEARYSGYQLAKIAERIRDKGNELYFQTGAPFANNALGIVQASEAYVAATTRDEAEKGRLLEKLKESRQRYFADYTKEMVHYQERAASGNVPNDAVSRHLLKFMDAK